MNYFGTIKGRMRLVAIFHIRAAASLAIAVLTVLLACRTAWAGAPIRIQCVGDSITAGYTDNPTWNVPFEFGYRSGLYTRLTDAGYSVPIRRGISRAVERGVRRAHEYALARPQDGRTRTNIAATADGAQAAS